MDITVEFPDKSTASFKKGVTCREVAEHIGKRLSSSAIAAKIDGMLVDLSQPIDRNCRITIITPSSPEGLEILRHSTAHLMAHAVMRLYPNALLTIGPVVEEGFYYDIGHEPFTPEDLAKIESEMARIANENLAIERIEITKSHALELFKSNKYKIEMIEELEGAISAYKQGDFIDLCKGPHVPATGHIKAFKLLRVAGAYWRADSKNAQLQRIYGISFSTKKELDEFLKIREEAEKRDHRKIGRELNLFSVHDEGPGFHFFHPNGMIIWNELLSFWREEHQKAGYVEIKTPIMLNRTLWERSGHWENYRENMYTLKIDDMEYAIKPMNCPGGFLWYKENMHSYKEFPLRVGEIGQVHRHELSGVLSGLFRVRSFHQDDAHIYMTPEQIHSEVLGVLNLSEKFYSKFGLDYHLELSTRPEKSVGTDKQWEMATQGLKDALDSTGKPYKINPGDGAFYGPKIDLHIKDCIGRTWQCGTIQLDMSLPERFDLTYIGEDGAKHRPVLIHRVIYGSLERFFGILIEHFAGKFPLWLAPVQVVIMTVTDRSNDYAKQLKNEMEKSGIRVNIDDLPQTINHKVRDAQMQKIPLMITVGDKEMENKTLAVRTLDGAVKFGIKPDELILLIKDAIANRSISFLI